MADQEEKQEQEIVEQSVTETENELLKGAFEPQAKETKEPVEEKAPEKVETAPEEGKVERERDPATGKFVKRQGDVEQKPQAVQEPPKEDEVLPSWRAREINEERRQVQAELERMRVEHARLQAWAAQVRQPEQKRPEAPDPVIDPAGYTKFVQDGLRAEFAEREARNNLNVNLQFAHMNHGERFEKAFEALTIEGQRGNQQLVRHLVGQANPGEAIMRWYTQAEVLREVGPDPAAYKQKTREQLLDDPEFRAQAEAHWRQQAMGGQPQKPNTVVRMPPSLSKATGSAEAPATGSDGSEAGIFNFAMQPKRR